MNVLPKCLHHDRVIQRVEAGGDVSPYEVGGSYPLVIALREGRVTSPLWAKSMRMRAELRLKVGRENESNDFLKQLIRPGGHPQGTQFVRAFLLDVNASNRGPSIALVSQELNDGVNFAQVHCVRGIRR